MVGRRFQVCHNDTYFDVDYDTDDGFEVSFSLFHLSFSLLFSPPLDMIPLVFAGFQIPAFLSHFCASWRSKGPKFTSFSLRYMFFCIYMSLWSYICVELLDEFVYHFDRLSELMMIGQSPPIPISPPSRRSSDWFRSMKKSRKWKINNPAAEMTPNCWNPTRNWLGCCRFGDCYCYCF